MQRLTPGGFSLLEVLISVVVVSLGVLGVLALLLTTMRAAQNADAESVAFSLGTELAEQLRGDASLVSLMARFDYDAAAPDSANSADSAAVSCYGLAASCSTAQLALFNMEDWKARIKARLPAGRVRICRDTTPWQESIKALRWDCDANGVSSAPLWIKLGWQDRMAGSNSSAPMLALHAD
ncbi:type IV pilus modification protein PilV [Actimicrobium antarcticum]|uniref:Type IV pilus modification protein PilV n=1 Tax=Actimicrobium antarcticum TaxID=1051899 RepID=A0ABP7TUA0_9BURK